jgi:hypothetical protein
MSSVLLVVVWGISVLLTTMLLVTAIKRNYINGQSIRVQYGNQVEALRFSRMLKKRKIDLHTLLHQEPLSIIQEQITNCRGCLKTAECDSVLNHSFVAETKLTFCPNYSSIAS